MDGGIGEKEAGPIVGVGGGADRFEDGGFCVVSDSFSPCLGSILGSGLSSGGKFSTSDHGAGNRHGLIVLHCIVLYRIVVIGTGRDVG